MRRKLKIRRIIFTIRFVFATEEPNLHFNRHFSRRFFWDVSNELACD